jgi:hypothetical protein
MPGVEAFNRHCQLFRFKPALDVFVRKRYYFFARGQVLNLRIQPPNEEFFTRP